MIREMKREEIPQCVDVIRKSFLTVAEELGFTTENAPRFTAFAMSEDRLYTQLEEGRPMFVYVDEKGNICGYYSLAMQENLECELNNLAVLPECRHQGIGRLLLEHAFSYAHSVGCTIVNISIVEENTVLRKWYESFGAVHILKWYIDRFPELRKAPPVYSVCGDDCAVCPRFLARTEEELHETAEFWYRAGWRDHVVSNDEIRCTGCGCRPTCSFMLLPCTKEHDVSWCKECPEFECKKIEDVYLRSASKMEQCRKACESEEEFQMFVRAFYQKEKNIRGVPM